MANKKYRIFGQSDNFSHGRLRPIFAKYTKRFTFKLSTSRGRLNVTADVHSERLLYILALHNRGDNITITRSGYQITDEPIFADATPLNFELNLN